MADNKITDPHSNEFLLADTTAVGLGGESFGPRMMKAITATLAALALGGLIFPFLGGSAALLVFLTVALGAGLSIAPDPRRSEGFRDRAAFFTLGRWTPDRRDGFLLDNLRDDAAFTRTEKPDLSYDGERYGTENGNQIDIRPPQCVGDTDWLILDWKGHTACALVDDQGTASIAFQVQSRSPGLTENDDLAQTKARLGQALDTLADREGFTDQLAQLLIVSPHGQDGAVTYDHLPADPGEWEAASYREAQDRIAGEAESYFNLWVLRIPKTPFRDKAVAALGAKATKANRETSGLCELIRREATDVMDALASGGQDILGPANVACTAMAIRNAFDRAYRPVRWNSRAPFGPNDAWPKAAPIDRRDAVITEGQHTSIAEVLWPEDWVKADFLRNLTTDIPATHRTIVTIHQLTPANESRLQARVALGLMKGNLLYRANKGYSETTTHAINRDAVETLESDVARGGRIVKTVTYLSVSTPCTDQCIANGHNLSTDQDDAKRRVALKASEVDIELRWLMKSHLRTLQNTMPYGRGLR